MKYIRAKKLVHAVKSGQSWFGVSFNVNIYRGCNQGCIYCDSRSSCYKIDNFDEVKVKQEADILIDQELSTKFKKGIIGLGGMNDPYNNYEKKLKYTQSALKSINKYNFGVNIITKSTLVIRDIDILKSINTHSPVCVGFTITTASDRLQARIERNVPSSTERFAAIKELSDNGLYTGILMMPILPFINDTEENIEQIVLKASESGAKFIFASFGVTLRDNQRQHFFKKIGPELTKKYVDAFGDSYVCSSLNAELLKKKFETLCAKYGIVYKMKDIIKGTNIIILGGIVMKVHAEHARIQEFLKQNPIDSIEVVDDIKRANYIVTGKYDKTKYNQNLKGIVIPYTGHNGIDLDTMREHETMLFITPTRSRYVAEKAVTLTLALLGKTVNYHTALKEGNWASRNSEERVPWVSIQNLSIGFYGYGRIGKQVHSLMRGFGCDFYTIDRHKEYPTKVHLVKNLTNLIQVSDVIIIAAPLNETTEGVFNDEKLLRMKHKFLINVARGNICDEEALYNALKSKKLKGYASDVWFNYPQGKEKQLPSKFPIYDLDNVVMSNHSGGFTENTNYEVNKDLLKILRKIRDENFEDKLNLKALI